MDSAADIVIPESILTNYGCDPAEGLALDLLDQVSHAQEEFLRLFDSRTADEAACLAASQALRDIELLLLHAQAELGMEALKNPLHEAV